MTPGSNHACCSFRGRRLSVLRFGFTLFYQREAALTIPFPDKNLGEDYDWCMDLIAPGLTQAGPGLEAEVAGD